MEVTFTEYFDYVHHPATLPDLVERRDPREHRVVIVGGGPTGLATAIGLARYGVESVIVEADDTVCSGSRAGAITRRTLEIFEQLGVIDAVLAKGFPWGTGITYLRDREVLRFEMPDDANQKFPPGLSLQQNYVELYLLHEVERYPDLIEVRWQSSVTAVSQHGAGVELQVETPLGTYGLQSDWVIACDGGRSAMRRELGLQMEGTAHEGRYVIIDIRIDTDGLPIGRRCWFDPPSNPGSTLLMYTKPDRMVRLDYQLDPSEDPEQASRPENVLPRVQQHLQMLGLDRPWEPVWLSLYRANALTLASYRHGRVLFAGDAAHLVPIFGVRGMNSSLDDAHNLAWKLALVVTGRARDELLDSYSVERVCAARENLRLASRGAEFMAPPSAPFRLMRDAVLSLVISHPWVSSLLNPRQHSAIPLYDSPLNAPDKGFAGGPRPGDLLPECPVVALDPSSGTAVRAHLLSLLGPHFTALYFHGDDSLSERISAPTALPLELLVVGGPSPLQDPDGRLAAMLDAAPGTLYLIRPDGHVLGRWRDAAAAELDSALTRIAGGRL